MSQENYQIYQEAAPQKGLLDFLLSTDSTLTGSKGKLAKFKGNLIDILQGDIEKAIDKVQSDSSGFDPFGLVLGILNPIAGAVYTGAKTGSKLIKQSKQAKKVAKELDKKYGKDMGFIKDAYDETGISDKFKDMEMSGGKILGKSMMSAGTSYLLSKLLEFPELGTPGTTASGASNIGVSIPGGDISAEALKSLPQSGTFAASSAVPKELVSVSPMDMSLPKGVLGPSPIAPSMSFEPAKFGKADFSVRDALEDIDLSELNFDDYMYPGYFEQLFKHYSPSSIKSRATGLKGRYGDKIKDYSQIAKGFGY